jgi:nuclear pore complex protein Nup155
VSAGYNDLCLVIYHLSDYRNEPEIAAAWKNFIEETHEEAVAKNETEPHILVQERVRALGRRVNCSETVFNPRTLRIRSPEIMSY